MTESSTAEKPRFWREPLDAGTLQVPKGKIHILKERCKGCGFCIEYCPRDVLEFSDEFNSKGYHFPVTANADACVSCGLCDLLCPEFAIYSETIETEEVGQGGK
jgi:2-oxoglutarate ferredoxin oxidoreductase subunit delta